MQRLCTMARGRGCARGARSVCVFRSWGGICWRPPGRSGGWGARGCTFFFPSFSSGSGQTSTCSPSPAPVCLSDGRSVTIACVSVLSFFVFSCVVASRRGRRSRWEKRLSVSRPFTPRRPSPSQRCLLQFLWLPASGTVLPWWQAAFARRLDSPWFACSGGPKRAARHRAPPSWFQLRENAYTWWVAVSHLKNRVGPAKEGQRACKCKNSTRATKRTLLQRQLQDNRPVHTKKKGKRLSGCPPPLEPGPSRGMAFARQHPSLGVHRLHAHGGPTPRRTHPSAPA